MQDLFWRLRDVDSFTLFCVPFLMAGGILAPMVFQEQMISLSFDKDSNVAAMSAAGVLATLVALIVVKWLWTLLKERRVRRTKLISAATPSPRKF
jgi:hypothetical protein